MGPVGHAQGGKRSAARVLAAFAVSGSMVGAVTWYGCSVYDSSLLLPAADSGVKDSSSATDAGTDAHDASKEAAPNPCPDFGPPAAPSADDPSNDGGQGFVVAVHTIDFGFDAGTLSTIGYDLDDIYTCCDGGAESCKAAQAGATHCDDVSGRDNSGGQLLASLFIIDPSQFTTATVSQRLQDGVYSILLQVSDYNGTPNDTQVTAALYGSDGVESDAGALWNGTDQWTVDESFVVNPNGMPLVPTDFDTAAYVADGTLVMHLSFPISSGTTSTDTFTINLTGGVITGQVVSAGNGTFALTGGNISGRWNVSQLLNSLQTVTIGANPICPTGPGASTYSFVKQEVCKYADIMTAQSMDNSGATCDALSLGIGFTADPALLGTVQAAAVKTSLCDSDAGPDDCTH